MPKFLSAGLTLTFSIFVGAMVARLNGVPSGAFLPGFAVTLLGLPLIYFSTSVAGFFQRYLFATATIAILLISSSLLGPGFESVHRWIVLGPVFLNISMAVVPIALYAMVYGTGFGPIFIFLVLSLLFVIQPDAGQATAFACATLVALTFDPKRNFFERVAGTFSIVAALAAWFRRDPLLPVDHVERILHLAYDAGMFWALAAFLSACLLLRPFVLGSLRESDHRSRVLSLVYLAYLAASFGVTELGNFPVPIIGAGAAPVFGWLVMASLIFGSGKGPNPTDLK